jgi:hypothetical protein
VIGVFELFNLAEIIALSLGVVVLIVFFGCVPEIIHVMHIRRLQRRRGKYDWHVHLASRERNERHIQGEWSALRKLQRSWGFRRPMPEPGLLDWLAWLRDALTRNVLMAASLLRKARVVRSEDVRALLLLTFERVATLGGVEVAVHAGKLHHRLGGYPARDHRMPVVCAVMREMMASNDEVIAQPASGDGANLVIRYKLPRKR